MANFLKSKELLYYDYFILPIITILNYLDLIAQQLKMSAIQKFFNIKKNRQKAIKLQSQLK